MILPPETLDPTPYLYNDALYTMSGLAALAAVANVTLKKVDPKYYEKVEDEVKAKVEEKSELK